MQHLSHQYIYIFQRIQTLLTRLPIRWRLALASFGLLVVLLSILGGLISVTVERLLFSNEALALHDEAQLALNGTKGHPLILPTTFNQPASSAAPSQRPGSPAGHAAPDIERTANDITARLTSADVRVTVLSTDDTVITSSQEQPPIPLPVPLSIDQIQQQLQQARQNDAYLLANDSQGQRQIVVLLPLLRDHDTLALLQLNASTESIDRSINTLHLILILGILSTLLLAALITLPLISAALRPLVLMEQTSKRIADGSLSLRLNVPPTNDEIGHLAASFNRMVERLEASFTRQKRFVADASHELRTPLTALGGSLEMLLTGIDPNNIEITHRLLRSMYTEVGRMRRLVEDLLALARIDEGAIVLRKEEININDLLARVYEQAQRFTTGQDIRYEASIQNKYLCVDGDRLQQVLLNLVENSLKFTPATGLVTLAARDSAEGWMRIEIEDTGAGIPAEALPHVFERFYRADQSRARSPQQRSGNGLGLAIAKELVEAHGGTIEIESCEGQGTKVVIRLLMRC
jgi:two-component system OmpR family sensor kinase